MCLAIPARLVEYVDEERMYGKVELGGVQRRINTSLLVGEDATEPGEYVLVHVGFALSRVSETEAAETLRILESLNLNKESSDKIFYKNLERITGHKLVK